MPKLEEQIENLRELITRTNPPAVMTPREAAEFLSVREGTLFQWRKDAVGPKYSQPSSRMVRYLREDLLSFMKEHRV